MLRSYLSAALGNIGRNGLYAGITILGLAVSFTAAILIGLYLRDEYSFDRFIPGRQHVFRLQADILLPGQKPLPADVTPSTAAAFMKLDFPEVRDTARLAMSQGLFKTAAQATEEPTAWVDPDFFRCSRATRTRPWPRRTAWCSRGKWRASTSARTPRSAERSWCNRGWAAPACRPASSGCCPPITPCGSWRSWPIPRPAVT
jgi:hypothetical protein